MNANEYLQRSTLYRKLIRGPYGEFSRVYAARLSDEGFGRRCTWRSLNLFRDLMDWHVGNGHNPQDLSEVHVERFLEHRSEHWSINAGDRAALRRLLSALRDEGLIPAAVPAERTEHEQIVDVFAAYLTNERGLAASTVESHKLLSHRFLQEVCPAGADGFAALSPEIVIGYVERCKRRSAPRTSRRRDCLSSATVRPETWPLTTFQTSSSGLSSGEYGGKKNSLSLPSRASTKSRTFFER